MGVALRIGSAPEDDLVLAGAGVAPHHVALAEDARGLVLTVAPQGRRVYVNARPVRERALLHHGDILTVGDGKVCVTTDTAPPAPAPAPRADQTDGGTVTLRIVSGVDSGQALPVRPELRLGAGTRHFDDLAYRCRVAQEAAGLVFEATGAAACVNGWPCQRALLAPGDQIALGPHRLLVEAPGMEHARYVASLPPPHPSAAGPMPQPGDPAHPEVWWLIVAAALLAIVIAAVLYFHG